jgi:hypothetical protein
MSTRQIASRKFGTDGPVVSAIGLGFGEELAGIARVNPRDAAAGARYPAMQMAMLDSEKQTVRA